MNDETAGNHLFDTDLCDNRKKITLINHITKKVLCDHFGSELYENEAALENVRRRMEAFGRELTDINRQQAWVPRCCTVLPNPLGTAPGMWCVTTVKK